MENNKNNKETFSFNLSQEGQEFLRELVYTKIVKGEMNCNLTTVFKEGLFLLQELNPDLPEDISLERRYYKGGTQKNKGTIYRTSIVSTIENNTWIKRYMAYKITSDFFFSKSDFINDLINALKDKYKGKLLKLPKKQIL